jgi:muramoyltetrapeptide carboxypeptidase
VASDRIRIGVVAPGSPMQPETAQAVTALAARLYPENPPDIHFHPQCFLTAGHFAGSDEARAAAFLDVANDPAYDALWFGRGGYGAVRIVDQVLPQLSSAARRKAYLGYSDSGFLLAALYREGFGRLAHGPVAQDIRRDGGEAAAGRAMAWLVEGREDVLEPSVDGDTPTAAFNLCILSHLVGTPWQPDLEGHVLMVEEVSEHLYRIDRFLAHVTANPAIRKIAGLRLGRCSDIPDNDPVFGEDEEAVARLWCGRAGIPYLGRADIGHDSANRIVPFGLP